MKKIKKHWREILIGVLTLFSLNKCTQSCNRANHNTELQSTVEIQDSIIKAKEAQISKLEYDTVQYINQLKLYKGFTQTMSENIAKQNEIAEQNAKNQASQKRQNELIIRKLNENNKNK